MEESRCIMPPHDPDTAAADRQKRRVFVPALARARIKKIIQLDRAESLASTAGCEIIELTSAATRAEAHAFYQSIGYEPNSLRFRKVLVA